MDVVIYCPLDNGEKLERLKTWCKSQGFKIVCFFRGRSEFNEALEMTKCADALIVASLGVICADVENLVALRRLKKDGKHLICVDDGIDTSSPKYGKGFWKLIEHLTVSSIQAAKKRPKGLHADLLPRDEITATLKVEVTLGRVLIDYLKCRKLKANTIEQYSQVMKSHMLDWLRRDIKTLSKADCMQRHHDLTASSGKYQANYVLGIVSYLMKFAANYYEDAHGKPLIVSNPVNALTLTKSWNKETANVDNFIRKADLPAWHNGIYKLKSQTLIDLYQFLLLTGLRLGEALQLVWNDIDLKNGFLTVRKTKNNRKHTLPLSSQAWAILSRRKLSKKPLNEFVFAGLKHGTAFGYAGQHRLIGKRIGIEFTPHGLRRSFAVTAAAIGIERPVISTLLNHHDGNVTSIYAVYEPEVLRPTMQKIADALITEPVSNLNKEASR